jgi:hypothetical protein
LRSSPEEATKSGWPSIHRGALDKALSGDYPAQEVELKKTNIRYEGDIYPDTIHGFFNDPGTLQHGHGSAGMDAYH